MRDRSPTIIPPYIVELRARADGSAGELLRGFITSYGYGHEAIKSSKFEQPMSTVIDSILEEAKNRSVRFTLHAHQKMVAEKIRVTDLLQVLSCAQLLEDYPDYERGPCCLVCGKTETGRPIHVVCTTSLPELVIITVYEPKPPKWITPYQRRPKP